MARSADFRKKFRAKEALANRIKEEERKIAEAKRKGDATQEGRSRVIINQLKPKLSKAEKEYLAAIREAVGEVAIGTKLKGLPGNVVRVTGGKVMDGVRALNVLKYLPKAPTAADIRQEARQFERIVDQDTQRYRQSGRNRLGVQYAARCGMCNLNSARHSPVCREPELRNASFTSEDRA